MGKTGKGVYTYTPIFLYVLYSVRICVTSEKTGIFRRYINRLERVLVGDNTINGG